MQQAKAQHQDRFIVLDAMRGVAAIAIAFRHAPFLWGSTRPQLLLRESYLAVDFFFVLSGFVLARAYEARLARDLSLRQFMLGRIVRLYPMYLLAFVFSAIYAIGHASAHAFGDDLLAPGLVLQALFLPAPSVEGALFPYNLPAWSLFFELGANCLFAAIAIGRTRKAYWALALGAGLTMLVAVPLGMFGFGASEGPLDAGIQYQEFGAGALRVTFSFFAGVILYHLRLAQRPAPPFGSALVIALLVGVLIAHPQGTAAIVFDLAAVLVIFPILVYVGSLCRVEGPVGRVLAHLGDQSYAIYVLQYPVFKLFVSVTRKFGLEDGYSMIDVPLGMVSMVVVMLGALLATRFYERRARHVLERVLLDTRRPGLRQRA